MCDLCFGLVFALKRQTKQHFLVGRAVVNPFDCADDGAAEDEKDYEGRMGTHVDGVECSLSFQSGLHPAVLTSALQNVIDLEHLHTHTPVVFSGCLLSVAIYFVLAC